MVRLACVVLMFAACVTAYPRGFNSGYERGSDERDASVSVSEEQGCNNNNGSGYSSSNRSYNTGNRELAYNKNGRQTSSTRTRKAVRGIVRSPASVAAASYGLGPKY